MYILNLKQVHEFCIQINQSPQVTSEEPEYCICYKIKLIKKHMKILELKNVITEVKIN